MKRNILWVSEASFLRTGFSTQTKAILEYFHKNRPDYNLIELGSYASSDDPRADQLPWKFHGSVPDGRDGLENKIYQTYEGQFGAAVFNKVLLEEEIDTVIDIRDPFFMDWQLKSPFRRNFNLIWQPTVDSEPQQKIWLDNFSQADRILSLSRYGKEVMEREASGIFNVFGIARPGVDHKAFVPRDRAECRKKFGIPNEANILLTVMRNQKRKLFPDLLQSFKDLIEKFARNNKKDLAQNTFLYLHTSYPDVGFDIPKFLMQNGLSSKVYFSYICRACHNVWADFWQTEITPCPRCKNLSGFLPNTNHGIETNDLCDIYNCADAYIQYSVCVAKGQKVKTKNGWKSIESITEQDHVLTHKGNYKKVLSLFKFPYKDDMKRVHLAADFETCDITEEHKVFCLSKKDFSGKNSPRKSLRKLIRDAKVIPEPSFKEIGTLSEGDLLVSYIDNSIEDIEKIDLANYIPKDNNLNIEILENDIVSMGHYYPRFIDIDEEFCKFAGLFVADGSWAEKGDIKITGSSSEKKTSLSFAQEYLLKIFNKEPSIRDYKNREATDVINYSMLHVLFFKLFKKHEQKCLPDFVDKLPINKQLALINGMFSGDGCIYERRNTKTSIYSTVSIDLARQLKNILNRLRIQYSCKKIIKKCNDNKNRKPQYTFCIGSSNLKNDNYVNKRNLNTRSIFYQNYRLTPISKIEDIEYSDDKVYSLEVEDDHSYMLTNTLVNNCEGLGMGPIEAKACGIPAFLVDYSAMSEQAECPGCYPIKVERFYTESWQETQQIRCYPDNEDAVKKLYDFFCQPKEKWALFKDIIRKDAVDGYSYERAAKVFESAIDSLPIRDPNKTWRNVIPYMLKNFPEIPKGIKSYGELVDLYITSVYKRPHLRTSEWRNGLVKSLNVGYNVLGQSKDQFNVESLHKMFDQLVKEHNYWESRRLSKYSAKENDEYVEWIKI